MKGDATGQEVGHAARMWQQRRGAYAPRHCVVGQKDGEAGRTWLGRWEAGPAARRGRGDGGNNNRPRLSVVREAGPRQAQRR